MRVEKQGQPKIEAPIATTFLLLISIAQKSRCARDLGEMVNHQIAELKIFVQQEI
jgi:hypothetical protein